MHTVLFQVATTAFCDKDTSGFLISVGFKCVHMNSIDLCYSFCFCSIEQYAHTKKVCRSRYVRCRSKFVPISGHLTFASSLLDNERKRTQRNKRKFTQIMGCCVASEIKILATDNIGNSAHNVLQPFHDVALERSVAIEVTTYVAVSEQGQQSEQMISHAVAPFTPDIINVRVGYLSADVDRNDDVDVDEVLAADSISLCGRVDEAEVHPSAALGASPLIGVSTLLPSSGSVLAGSNQDYPASQIRDPASSSSVERGDVDSAGLLFPDGSLVHMMLFADSGDECRCISD